MVDFTVAICTYNGETRLPKVLEQLRIACDKAAPSFVCVSENDYSSSVTEDTKKRSQSSASTHNENFSWEILVVDNNSTDNTAKIVQEYQANWSKTHPIRYYFESEQGIAFARRCAIKNAKGSLIGFLDDDNLPTPNWVHEAYSFSQLHPNAGAYGSQIHGDYEVEPPRDFKRIACFLAIVERGNKPFRYDAKQWLFPAGAGLVIRKQAWLSSVPERPILKGVSAQSLVSKGEDIETLSYIQKAGWEIWYNPQMRIYHQIPRSRLEKAYLLKLFRGVGLSRYPTRMIRFEVWQRPFVLPLYVANDLRRLITHFIKYRKYLKTDIVVICELELFLSSLISPFYHWLFVNK